MELLNSDEDDIIRFNAAQALAYRGRKDGLELLQQCASGVKVLSSSGHERHEAALALLLLNEGLPQEYLSHFSADRLYLKFAKENR